jgi:hypothetical protein
MLAKGELSMIWVYAQKPVACDRELAQALGGQLVRAFDGETFWVKGKRVAPLPNDTVITLSGGFPKVTGFTVFNGEDKEIADDMCTLYGLLQAVGIVTPRLSPLRHDGWLGRVLDHREATDLITPPTRPELWVEKTVAPREFRIHVFNGKIIGAGQKVATGPFAHPWIRTERTGWRVVYGNKAELGRRLKGSLDSVMTHMCMDFASFDLGETDNRDTVVFGIDRSPKLDSRVLPAYVKAFSGDLK